MTGLYSIDGSFRDETEIRRDVSLREANEQPQQPQYNTPLSEDRNFQYWNQRLSRRAREHQETDEAVRYAEIALPNRPCLVSALGDQHVGNYTVDYERVEAECQAVKDTPFSYVGFMGDLVDHMFFNPAEAYDEVEGFPAQTEWAKSLFRYMNDGENPNKMLFATVGNHDDKWAKKTGLSLYNEFSRTYGAYLFRGVSTLDLKMGDSKFTGVISHQMPGNSGYNANHPQTRFLRDSGMALDVDFVLAGHTHRKAVQQQSYGNGRRGKRVVVGNIGTSKRQDSYGEDKGFTPATDEQMNGLSFIFIPKPRYIIPFDDVLVAHQVFREHFI